ncbi:hypothetical protein D3C78_1647070 [compost metagenome]
MLHRIGALETIDVFEVLLRDYWHEHLQAGVDLQSVHDDASVLSLEHGEPAIKQQTDCDNFAVTVA